MTKSPPHQKKPTLHNGFAWARSTLRTGMGLFGAVVGFGVGLLLCGLVLDVSLSGLTLGQVASGIEESGLTLAMGSLGEIMAAVLGLSLTVVAIVVQLASQRYPARIVDLFMTDRRNTLFFAVLTSSCVFMVLAPTVATLRPAPVVTLGIAVCLTALNFGMLLPYFGHVFAFLEPASIITKIRARAEVALVRASRPGVDAVTLERCKSHVRQAIERISDNSMAAAHKSDRNLAMHTVRSLEGMVCDYLEAKGTLPASWATPEAGVMVTLSNEFRSRILSDNLWVEAKTLMEFDRLLRASLGNQMSELISQLGASSRRIGQTALVAQDMKVFELTIQFFNTYLRHALNARDVRACYNVLYEYKLFATFMSSHEPRLSARVVEHMVYYGRTANAMGLAFVTVTVAHDVRAMCEHLYDEPQGCDVGVLVRLLLTLDQASENRRQETALLGVRRAQAILGAFLLSRQEQALAQAIREDMQHEPQGRLVQVRDEILGVQSNVFWEITDRGVNFDYIEPERRPYLEAFFEPLLEDPAGVILPA